MPRLQSFVTIPSDAALRDRKNWARKGSEYVAVRHQFLVVEEQETKVRNGPAFSTVSVPVDIDVRELKKRITTITATSSVTETIESTLSVKLSQEIASSLKGGLKELGAEVQSRVGSEIVEALRTSLSGTRTYSVSESQEDSREISYKVPKRGTEMQVVNKFVQLHRHVRDVYLVRSDAMTVRWTSILGFKSREDISEHIDPKVIPLFRVIWHEPQAGNDYGMTFGEYEPEVDADEMVDVVELTDDLGFSPNFGRRPSLTALSELANIAFPTTLGAKKAELEHERTHVAPPARRRSPTRRTAAKKRSSSAKKSSSKRSSKSRSKKKG